MYSNIEDVWKKLDKFKDAPLVPALKIEGEKYVLLSDIHLGNGSEVDDFYENEAVLVRALDHYLANNFHLILIGDIEELWQFDLHVIKNRYDENIYSRMREFYPDRVTRIFGNHDYEWGGYTDPIFKNPISNVAPEAVKLIDINGAARFLLVHGHQGTLESDIFSWWSRFWVRLLGFIEPLAKRIGVYPRTSATKSQIAEDYESTLYQWAKKNKIILICGHSHRAIFASKSRAEALRKDIAGLEALNSKIELDFSQRLENLRKIRPLKNELKDEKSKGRNIQAMDPDGEPLPCYFNTGCCIYTDGLTAIEIENDTIRLVKWNRKKPQGASDPLVYQEGKLSEILAKVA